jgi:uncharacterized protein YjbJ (UPF0337 family)
MDWDRISGNWAWWRERVQERWSRLSSNELDLIAGRRDELAGRLEVVYGLSSAEAERQLRNWERKLAADELAMSDLALDDDAETSEMNGRG